MQLQVSQLLKFIFVDDARTGQYLDNGVFSKKVDGMIKTSFIGLLQILHLLQFFQRLDQNQVRLSPQSFTFCLNHIINHRKHKDDLRSSGLVIFALQEVHQLGFWVMSKELILLGFCLDGQLDVQCLFPIGVVDSDESFCGIQI